MAFQRFGCHQRKFHDKVKNLVHDIPTFLDTIMLLSGHHILLKYVFSLPVWVALCIRRMKCATCPFHTGGLDSTLYCKQEWPLPDCGASPQKRSSREPSDQSESSIASAFYWQAFTCSHWLYNLATVSLFSLSESMDAKVMWFGIGFCSGFSSCQGNLIIRSNIYILTGFGK